MLNTQDIKTLIKLLAVVWLGLAFVVLLREVAGSLTLRDWNYAALADLENITLRMWLPWLVLSPFLVMAIKKTLFYPDRWMRTLLFHMVFAMLFIFIHLAAVAYHYQYFETDKIDTMRVYAGWEHMGHFLVADPFVLTDFIIYVLFVASFNMSNYIQLVKQKEQDAVQLEASLTAAKLHALQMQVNPHFLFNTLNSISVLVQKKDFDSAGEMIHRLSDFFRMTLEKSADHLVPLESELELVENYLAIEQMRFKDRLKIELDIDRRTLSATVPAMILQPLVENSLRHGISALESQGTLSISSRSMADRVLLEVTDNGAGCEAIASPEFREGIGLKNVRGRLQQIYGKDFVFSINANSDTGVTVAIEIPSSVTVALESQDKRAVNTAADISRLTPREV